jgi:chromosome segregation ATPase
MKTLKDLKKEVDSALKGKVKDVLEAFQSQRDNDLQEFANLNEQLEGFQNQKKELLRTQETEAKNFIPSQKILNECFLKMNHVEKLIRETQKKIDALFKKLTAYPESIKEIYPFLRLIQG